MGQLASNCQKPKMIYFVEMVKDQEQRDIRTSIQFIMTLRGYGRGFGGSRVIRFYFLM